MKKEDFEKLTKEEIIDLYLKLQAENISLHEKSITDGLTGLHNRASYDDHMKVQLSITKRDKNKKLSLIVLDLDKFKNVNDTYGHAMGDMVLKNCAKYLDKNSRDSDIACRFGGEELILVLPNTDINQAKIVAEKIRKGLESYQYTAEDGTKFKVTGSFGVAEYHENDTEKDIFEKADKALYEAKRLGRNMVVEYQSPVKIKVGTDIDFDKDMFFEEKSGKNIQYKKRQQKNTRINHI